MADYSFLTEIWTEQEYVQTQTPPQCSLYNHKDGDKLDNIMDAYISEESITTKCNNVDSIKGYDDSVLMKYAMELDSYYDNDLSMVTTEEEQIMPIENPACSITQEEAHKKIYNNIVESFKNDVFDNTYYIEIAIYVLSGIFLIFIMEQILQLGKHIRR